MKRVRVSFKNSCHHVMNKGILQEKIFTTDEMKLYFIGLAFKKAIKFKIQIYAYCVMENHFHIILKNSGNKLSAYMKELDSAFALSYRKQFGGKGYVFQNRFKSTLIENDQYIKTALIYVMLNPVRAGYVSNPYEYKWSSINEYFNNRSLSPIDSEFVEQLFQSAREFNNLLFSWIGKKISINKTKYGEVIGSNDFVERALQKFNRRKAQNSKLGMRVKENEFKTQKEVVENFEKKHGISIDDIDLKTHEGKKLRGEFLVNLKDECDITYKQMKQLAIFKDIKYNSMGHTYKRYCLKKVKK